ncbi:MAG TPA: hypothetical protein VIL11_03870 [Limnochordales bacterium]
MKAWTEAARRALVGAALAAAVAAALQGGCWPAARAGERAEASYRPSPASGGAFSELAPGQWEYRALQELAEAGLVVEQPPGLLSGRHSITRYEAALLLVDMFRRAHAVDEAAPGGAPPAWRLLRVDRLLSSSGVAGSRRAAALEGTLRRLLRELDGELEVLGFRPAGQDAAALAAPPPAGATVAWELGASLQAGGPGQGVASGLSPTGSGAGSAGGLGAAGMYPRLGLSVGQPGRFQVKGAVSLPDLRAEPGVEALVKASDEQWVLARAGEVGLPGAGSLAYEEGERLSLQGIEAHLVGRAGRAGVVVAQGSPLSDDGQKGAARDIVAVESSVVVRPDVVVGARLIRAGPAGRESLGQAGGTLVTSLTTRLRPSPWLTLTGEYVQNGWALPPAGAAMRLGASLRLGDVRVGAQVGSVQAEFRPVVGEWRAGARVGLDTAVRLGEVELRAGTSRLAPWDGGGQEVSTAWGVTVDLEPGSFVQADFERVSVQELASSRGSDRSRTAVRLGWESDRTRLAMGLAWHRQDARDATAAGSRGMEAEASVAYQLNPGTALTFGYRLIDFGASSGSGLQANASAAFSVRF